MSASGSLFWPFSHSITSASIRTGPEFLTGEKLTTHCFRPAHPRRECRCQSHHLIFHQRLQFRPHAEHSAPDALPRLCLTMLITIPLFLSAFAGADDTDNFKTTFEPNAMSNQNDHNAMDKARVCQRILHSHNAPDVTGVGDRQTPVPHPQSGHRASSGCF